MGLLSRAKQNSAAKPDDKSVEQKPATTFWDDQTPAQRGKKQQSKVETSEHVFGDPTIQVDASIELQVDLRSAPSSREYLQQSMDASAANVNVPPTKPATAMRT